MLLLSAFVLSGLGMFILVRSLTHHFGAALVAGLVFAFLPYRLLHYHHVVLLMAQWMPLCLWALHRTVAHGRLSDGILAGAFFTLQMLSSLYYGIFFATYLALVVPILLTGAGRRKAVTAFKPSCGAADRAFRDSLSRGAPHCRRAKVRRGSHL